MNKEAKEQALTTEQKIENWKAKYGEVYIYEANGKKCYLRKPDRKALSAASVIGGKDPMKYNEVLLNNCWLEGDEIIKTNDEYFMGVSQVLAELIVIKEGKLKKL